MTPAQYAKADRWITRLCVLFLFIVALVLAFRVGQWYSDRQDAQLVRVNYEALPVVQDYTYCRRSGNGKSKYHETRIIRLEGQL